MSAYSLTPPVQRAGRAPHGAYSRAPSSPSRGTSPGPTPYSSARSAQSTPTMGQSASEKFALPSDPAAWGHGLTMEFTEPDDYLHNPDPRRDKANDQGGTIFTARGFANLGCLLLLVAGLLCLFAGYPIITHFTKKTMSKQGGFNFGGTNASGQVPSMGNFGLIDQDTPRDAYTKKPYYAGGPDWQLVFSDEFNVDGRSFYPGDDPYWEANDFHYWGTNNLEWYDPAAITTEGGALRITLKRKKTHDLDYEGGMMATWNKFCFTGGLIEASVTLPGINNVAGLWPAVWTMGNLGRAGYGATLEGMWPFTYDSCDVGTVANQTVNGLPLAATVDGDASKGGVLSYHPGQRLSRCTCPGESHPGPVHADGTYVGRAAPEIDVFEAQNTGTPVTGQVSQSGQWAPYNAKYEWFNTSDNMIILNPDTYLNTYVGGVYQQTTSGVTETDPNCYELAPNPCFSLYGFEYKPGFDDSYIGWISRGQLDWVLTGAGMAADPRTEIGPRPIPQEPMYIIVNLGISHNFAFVDLDHLTFPTVMSVDYIRVYQPSDAINIGCDPPEFPTKTYIDRYIEAYTNPNFTTWTDGYGQPMPKNSFLGQC